MNISALLTWSGVPFFFFSALSDLIYQICINREPAFPYGTYILALMESYCFLLSLLLRLFFIYNPTDQDLISQGIYAINANMLYSFAVLAVIESRYDFFEIVSQGIKILTIVTWTAASILFALIATESFTTKVWVGEDELKEYFYLDVIIFVIAFWKVVHWWSRAEEIRFEGKMMVFVVFFQFFWAGLWIGSMICGCFDEGIIYLLRNLGQAGICAAGVFPCLQFLVFRRVGCSKESGGGFERLNDITYHPYNRVEQ